MSRQLQGQKLGLCRRPAAMSLRLREADAGDSLVLQLRSPALWSPSSHPSALPAAPGICKDFSGLGQGPCPYKAPSHYPFQLAPLSSSSHLPHKCHPSQNSSS